MKTRSYLAISAALLLLTAPSYSAEVKISELPAGDPLDGTELVPVVQDGTTVRTTTEDIAETVLPIDAATEVSGILPAANGGTANGFTAITGPATSTKTFTLPNSSATILTNAAAVTVPQGGTGATTLTGVVHGNGAGAMTAGNVALASEVSGTLPVANGGTNLTASADDNVMVGNGTTWQTKAVPDCDSANNALNYDVTGNSFSCQTISGGGGVGSVSVAYKPTSTARTNNTRTADPALQIANLPAAFYAIQGYACFSNPNATPNAIWALSSTNVPATTYYTSGIADFGGTLAATANLVSVTYTVDLAANTVQCIPFWSTYQITSTTTVTFDWAQQVTDGANATTLRQGSWMTATRLN